MNLPKLDNLEISNKKVIVRVDLDIDLDKENDALRLQVMVPTINHLIEGNARVILIGHRGRPVGDIQKDIGLSLKTVSERLSGILGKQIAFIPHMSEQLPEFQITMLENLRFDPQEENNDPQLARKLASLGDLYVNEAFAASHREHASIVVLPKLLPHAAGYRFVQEVENLSKIFESPKKPVIAIIGGAKEDKLTYVEGFKSFSDKIHLVGALPTFLEESNDPKVVVADLLPDKEDLTIHSIEKIEMDVSGAGTVILAGPVGKFEEEGHLLGTKRVLEAIGRSTAFKIAGGGDTEAAIASLGLRDKFDWISVGGGAMLEFLAKRTLPGIEVLSN